MKNHPMPAPLQFPAERGHGVEMAWDAGTDRTDDCHANDVIRFATSCALDIETGGEFVLL